MGIRSPFFYCYSSRILDFRMKRAMELLQEGIYNVSEIAYKVGMNDPLYFSKCFKSHFGAPPSAYLHKK